MMGQTMKDDLLDMETRLQNTAPLKTRQFQPAKTKKVVKRINHARRYKALTPISVVRGR